MGNSSSSISRTEVIKHLYNKDEVEKLYKRHGGAVGSTVQIPIESLVRAGLSSSPSQPVDLLANEVNQALGPSLFDKR